MAKILLVEDDKSLREIYGVRLMAEGYEIVSAGDGEEALAMAIKERPDLIVSDVMMPKISGFDMLDILRSTTETKNVKIIMMTALSSDDQRARGEALGADRYLVKSQVGIEDVVRTVHDVLGDGKASEPAPAPVAAATAPVVAPQPVQVQAPAPEPAATVAPTPQIPVAAPTPVALVAQAPQPVNVPTPQPAAAPVTPTPAAPAPAPVYVEPVQQPAPAAPVTTPQPPAAPMPTPSPAPAYAPPAAPVAEPTPASTTLSELPPNPAPVAPAPVVAPAPNPLPQPTAPFSSPAPASLGERVIEPLTSPENLTQFNTDIANKMAQELDPNNNQSQTPPAF
ncbi:MAG: response regulator [Candidatus Microsaccharimonas sp.]